MRLIELPSVSPLAFRRGGLLYQRLPGKKFIAMLLNKDDRMGCSCRGEAGANLMPSTRTRQVKFMVLLLGALCLVPALSGCHPPGRSLQALAPKGLHADQPPPEE